MNHATTKQSDIHVSQTGGALEKTRERRQWVRFILPSVVTMVSWKSGERTISELVNLVNVGGQSATVLTELEPPSNQPFILCFDDGNESTGPIPATLVSKQAVAGKTLATFRFDSVDTSRRIIIHQREQRAWQRSIPKNQQATLSWQDTDRLVSGPCEILNISGGGVAVLTEVPPPANQAIWFSVIVNGEETDPAECRLVDSSREPTGKHLARFEFVALCPFNIFKAAMAPLE